MSITVLLLMNNFFYKFFTLVSSLCMNTNVFICIKCLNLIFFFLNEKCLNEIF